MGIRGNLRRDSKRRVLRAGESIRADGKYQFKYYVDGKAKFVYSWKLEPTDRLPAGKKPYDGYGTRRTLSFDKNRSKAQYKSELQLCA